MAAKDLEHKKCQKCGTLFISECEQSETLPGEASIRVDRSLVQHDFGKKHEKYLKHTTVQSKWLQEELAGLRNAV